MVKMEQDAEIRSLPLSLLPNSTKRMLSDLLNSTKVIMTDGPNRLPRDWRGLAALANITSELEASIQEHPDKTARVLELWTRNKSATVGNLLDNLQMLDRYDVYDDVCLDLNNPSTKKDLRIVNHIPNNNINNNQPSLIITEYDDSEILTYDDRPGYKHMYDAYVLYADEDQNFVDELKSYLGNEGLEICTKEKLLPGHVTQYSPVSKLISERCQRVILVYSSEFLKSSANTFYRDYAQAISIESRQNKTLPIMYRSCVLPPHLALYHMLRYNSGMYSFWEKLAQALHITRVPRILNTPGSVQNGNSMQSAHSAVNIVEISNDTFLNAHDDRLASQRSVSVEAVPTSSSSPEGSISSETSPGAKKKSSFLKSFLTVVKGKKGKEKGIMVSC